MKTVEPEQIAWQPFTFGGVGLFAHARLGRVFELGFIFSLLLGGLAGWIFFAHYVPRIDEAISNLPSEGASILRGRLVWPSTELAALTEGPFLGIAVDPVVGRDPIQSADFQVVIAPRELTLSSMFGYSPLPYPRDLSLVLNRPMVEPRWGAWRVFVAIGAGAIMSIGLWLSWTLLALLYAGPVRLLGFYLDRAFNIRGAFKLSYAALMPGAVFLGGGLFFYSTHEISLPGLVIAFALHFIWQWVFLIGGVMKAPSFSKRLKNPFVPAPTRKNPFRHGQDDEAAD